MSGATLVIGAGSNLGGRRSILRAACDLVASRFGASDLRVAPVWETPPLGPPQPDYLNTAFAFTFDGSLDDALERCRGVERAFGRERRERWGARTLDLDLLWHASLRAETAALVVPHPGLRERAFALDPLLALVPDAVDPRDGTPLRTARAALPPSPPGVALDQAPATDADRLADEAEALGRNPRLTAGAWVPVELRLPWDPGASPAERRSGLLSAVHRRYDVQEGMLRRVAVIEDSPELTRAVLLLDAREGALRDR